MDDDAFKKLMDETIPNDSPATMNDSWLDELTQGATSFESNAALDNAVSENMLAGIPDNAVSETTLTGTPSNGFGISQQLANWYRSPMTGNQPPMNWSQPPMNWSQPPMNWSQPRMNGNQAYVKSSPPPINSPRKRKTAIASQPSTPRTIAPKPIGYKSPMETTTPNSTAPKPIKKKLLFESKEDRVKLTYHACVYMSLDGFIARKDGSCTFPDTIAAERNSPAYHDYGIPAFKKSMDIILMGRSTLEQLISQKKPGEGLPSGRTIIFVPTATLLERTPEVPSHVILLKTEGREDPPWLHSREIVQRLKKWCASQHPSPYKTSENGKIAKKFNENQEIRVLLQGGSVVSRFIEHHLLHEIMITTIPILLGSGVRLWGHVDGDVKLDVVDSGRWDNGFIQTRYKLRYARGYEERS